MTPSITDPRAVRRAARRGELEGPTRGFARGHVQCNLVVLPHRWAQEFEAWCDANHDACPILARSEPGDPRLPALGTDLDVRADLPAYSVFVDGERVAQPTEVSDRWRDDLVTFAFGCSFSLEDLFRDAGVDLAYEDRGFRGAIYVTSRRTVSVAGFGGPLVVSMRPLRGPDAIQAITTSAAHPLLHGAPVHVGRPDELGIDLLDPYDHLGDVSIADDELPVYWACGVTPQFALETARPELVITHRSGHMLVTDLRSEDLRGVARR